MELLDRPDLQVRQIHRGQQCDFRSGRILLGGGPTRGLHPRRLHFVSQRLSVNAAKTSSLSGPSRTCRRLLSSMCQPSCQRALPVLPSRKAMTTSGSGLSLSTCGGCCKLHTIAHITDPYTDTCLSEQILQVHLVELLPERPPVTRWRSQTGRSEEAEGRTRRLPRSSCVRSVASSNRGQSSSAES